MLKFLSAKAKSQHQKIPAFFTLKGVFDEEAEQCFELRIS